jgi:hypothetical protein
VADLKAEGASLSAGGGKLSRAPDHLTGPLKDFTAAAGDLSAFGVLGSLLKATGEIRDGMHQLSGIVGALGGEWKAEGKALGDVGTVLEEVDVLLKDALGARRG